MRIRIFFADLKDFQCVSKSILKLIKAIMYVSLNGGMWKVWVCQRKRFSGFVLQHCLIYCGFTPAAPDVICWEKCLPHFISIVSPSSSADFSVKVFGTKISRLMLLRSLYLWPSVQFTAIRPFTCELKLFEAKRSAFIIWPPALKEEDNTEFNSVIKSEVYSEFWAVNNLMYILWVLSVFVANIHTYSVCLTGLSSCTN